MKLHTYYKQVLNQFTVSYMVTTKLQKNGSYYGAIFTSDCLSTAGKAKWDSFNYYHPSPIEIEASEIPVKILNKLQDKIA